MGQQSKRHILFVQKNSWDIRVYSCRARTRSRPNWLEQISSVYWNITATYWDIREKVWLYTRGRVGNSWWFQFSISQSLDYRTYKVHRSAWLQVRGRVHRIHERQVYFTTLQLNQVWCKSLSWRINRCRKSIEMGARRHWYADDWHHENLEVWIISARQIDQFGSIHWVLRRFSF